MLAPLAAALLVTAAPAATAGPRPAGGVASPGAYAHYLRAREAEMRGDWALVTEELRQALAFDSGSASLHASLAEAWARVGQLDRAQAAARRCLDLDPEGAPAAEAHLLLGKLAMLGRRGPEAARELRESIRVQVANAAGRPPDEAALDPEAWRLLAQVELDAGRDAAAVLALEELAARLPDAGAASLRDLGTHYLERGDAGRAEAVLRKALERDRREVEAWRRLAQLQESRERIDDARRSWEGLLREDPEDVDALLAQGRLALRSGDPAAARAWFAQLLLVARDEPSALVSVALAWIDARRPAEALAVAAEGSGSSAGDARLRYARGAALSDMRRWTEAAEAFASVSGEDAALVSGARAAQAFALVQAGRGGEALSTVEAALRDRPGDARLEAARAWVLDRMGRSAEAVALLEAAVASRRGDPAGVPVELYEALSASLQRAGRAGEAVRMLGRAVAERPRDESLRYALGVAHERAGDRDAAVRAMQDLLDLNPANAEAMNFVGYSWAERGERLEEAERLVTRALELKPGSAAFLDSLGWIHYQKGDFGRAVAYLERADAQGGPEPTILEHLGDAYRRTLRASEAARAYQRALEAFEAGAEPETPSQREKIERKLGEVRAAEIRSPRPPP